jgi:hypothetical protein
LREPAEAYDSDFGDKSEPPSVENEPFGEENVEGSDT